MADAVVHLSPNNGMSSFCGERRAFCWASLEKALASGDACPTCLSAIRPPPMPPMMLMIIVIPVPMATATATAAEPERRNVIDVQEV